MKIALLMNQNSYAGREFLFSLDTFNIKVDVVIFKNRKIIDKLEEERCNGIWKPKKLNDLKKKYNIYRFSNINDKKFYSLLKSKKYDLGIQGGIGKVNTLVINKFKTGLLNFHPGKLPIYAGCTTPEWQIYEEKKVICTAHFIDKDIDSGPIYGFKELNLNYKDYFHMRSSVYPQISIFVVEVIQQLIEKIKSGKKIKLKPQNKKNRLYRKPIDQKKLDKVKYFINLKNRNNINLKDVKIRILKVKDVTTNYVSWFEDKEVVKYSNNQYRSFSLKTQKEYVNNCLQNNDADLYGIFHKKQHVGNILIWNLSDWHRRAEIGYVIGDKSYWGSGIASLAIKEIIKISKTKYKMNKIIANCASFNEASKKCLEKNGFMLEGVKIKNLYYNGEWHDQFDYGLLL